jgi:hypothetical protein
MKMKWTLLLLAAFCFSQIFAQPIQTADQPTIADIGFCAADHMHETAKKDKAWAMRHAQIEQEAYNYFLNQEAPQGLNALSPDYVLPVVVHIIHDNGPENISDAVVLQGIQDLNDAFANVGYYNPNTGVDTKIQFCLAQRDPDGAATTGINRVETPLTEMVLETDDITVKDLSRWDPTQYINIWLVREICSSGYGCGVAGYAYFPASHGQPEDGIMMEAEFFGSTQGNSGVQVHEMGHYLGLYHTFQGGCVNNDCLADGDLVCDTPPDGSTAPVPCSGSVNSCSTDANSGFPTDQDDLFEAYMDYGDFNCWSVFTQGQTDRMTWHIDNVRFSLLDSPGCLDPCLSALAASFIADQTTLDVGGTVNFENTSMNSTTASWEVDGVPFSVATDASYQFNSVGTFEICLNIGNDDPNCTDQTCQMITVTCPVQAEFSTSIFYPNPGETVNYSNSSINGNDYTWTVNGTPVSTAPDLSYTWDNQGIYDLCLIAGNGLCDAEFCLPVFVTEGTIGECEESTFVRYFGEEDVDEEGLLIVPSGDGNLYLGARSGSESLIIKMDIDGEPIWQRSFQFSTEWDILTDLLVDSEGNVVGCGYGDDGIGTDFESFAFKYDPSSNTVIWAHRYSLEGRSFSVFEPTPGGDYILVQDMRNSPPPGVAEDAILREVDRNTGNETGNLGHNYHLGSSETFNSTVLVNGDLYTTGRYTNGAGVTNMRTSLSRIDLAGNETWSRLSHVSMSSSARLYGRDLIHENGELILVSSGDDNGGSATVTNFFLENYDLNGNQNWVRKYELAAFQNEWVEEIVSVSDGFVLLGHERAAPGQLFLVKTDKDGIAEWAKSYGGPGVEQLRFTPQSQIMAIGEFLYFTAMSDANSNSEDILLIKTDSEGNLEDECILVEDLKVTTITINNPSSTSFTLTKHDNPQAQINVNADPLMAGLPFEDEEGCFCEPEISCDTTFLKSYGTAIDDEVSHAIALVPDALGGGFLLGGGKADSAMITLVDPAGDIIWTRSFDATFAAADFIWDISFDSDNNVVGVGQTKDEPLDNVECLAFKYNMVTNQILWINELDLADPANEGYFSIVEKAPGGNYIVAGQVDNLDAGGTGCDGVIVELNRNSGANVWQNNYSLGSCETFRRTILAGGSLYSTGRYNFDGGGTNRMRPGLTRFDLNGNQLWSRLYLEGVTSFDNARLYSTDLIEDNGLVIVGHGDATGSSTIDNIVFLFKVDLNGNLLWARQYDLPGSNSERTSRILNLPDGYVVLGFHETGDRDGFVFKTDNQGNLLWSKSFGTPDGEEEAWDMVWRDGQIFFTGNTTGLGLGTSEDMYLVNLSAEGTTNAEDSCNLFVDLPMTETDWPSPYSGQHNLTNLNQTWGFFLDFATMGETAVQSTIACFNPCVDECDLLPEVSVVATIGSCELSDINISIEVCNEGNFDLPAGTPFTVYEGDPTAGVAGIVGTYLTPDAVENEECLDFDVLIPGDPNITYYVLINEDGTTPLPLDLSDFEGIEEECDYTNNMGSFEVPYVSPQLDLGPDVETCEFAAVELDAGPGFATYDWNDGSTMQTTTAWFPGTYWVDVTDECGFTSSDTINILVDSIAVLDLGPDLEVCEGGSLEFALEGYESYEWSPGDYLSCDDCPNPTVTPESDITYTVVASNLDGCVSVDSVTIILLPGFETSEEIDLCEGQSVEVFGEEVTDAGVYEMTFSSQDGCDSTHTVTVVLLDNIFTEEEVSICDGETIDIFGDSVGEAGVYEMTFEATNGCDSTHTITVEVLDNIFTTEDIFICFGETADIFGDPVGEAGVYEMTFEAANGCDSTHTITLEVNPEILLNFSVVNATCFEATDGAITATASGGSGTFFYEWEDGTMDPELTDIPAGTYSVTATDADNGCTATDAVLVDQPPMLEAEVQVVNVSCDALGSATVMASGGTPGDPEAYTYVWSTGSAEATISDLIAGTYSVTTTDGNGCTFINTVDVTGALSPTVDISILQELTIDDPMGGELSAVITGGEGPYEILWNNGETLNIIDGLGSGEYIVVVTDANGCTATDTAYLFLDGCLGGEVWKDINRDGCQDGGELGISEVTLQLNGTDIWGNSVFQEVQTIFNGEYLFTGLPPGDYQVNLVVPTDYLLSDQDACGNDEVDSDFSTSLLSPIVAIGEGECPLNIDAGLYEACINVIDPGEICCDQVLCGPGVDPDPITEVQAPTGAFPIEYMWMYSPVGGDIDNGTWINIPNSNTSSFDPGPLFETTYFTRCVRGVDCESWLESNTVLIEVGTDAVAHIIAENGPYCVGESYFFMALPGSMGATYSWDFGAGANPPTSNEAFVYVSWAEAGYPTVTLEVTDNECTSMATLPIAVSDSDVYCGSSLQPEFGDGPQLEIRSSDLVEEVKFELFPNPVREELNIRWDTDLGDRVQLELRSVNGRTIDRLEVDGAAGTSTIDISTYAPGVYLLVVEYGELAVFRVIKT